MGIRFVSEDQHLPDAYTIPLVGKWQVANAAWMAG
jgi:hypothetical protein